MTSHGLPSLTHSGSSEAPGLAVSVLCSNDGSLLLLSPPQACLSGIKIHVTNTSAAWTADRTSCLCRPGHPVSAALCVGLATSPPSATTDCLGPQWDGTRAAPTALGEGMRLPVHTPATQTLQPERTSSRRWSGGEKKPLTQDARAAPLLWGDLGGAGNWVDCRLVSRLHFETPRAATRSRRSGGSGHACLPRAARKLAGARGTPGLRSVGAGCQWGPRLPVSPTWMPGSPGPR